MIKWALLIWIITIVLLVLLPAQFGQVKFFIGGFGIGLGIVLLLIGQLPWHKEE